MKWFLFFLWLFRKKGNEAGEREEENLDSAWAEPSSLFDCPTTRFETQPAELITQPMGREEPDDTPERGRGEGL